MAKVTAGVGDHEFEENLRPVIGADGLRPAGQRLRCKGTEQTAALERPVDDHRQALFGGQWQQALLGLGGKYAPMSFIPEDPSLN